MYIVKSLFCSLILFLSSQICYCLECYVCTNQDDNVGKCLTTIKTCEQGEDMCLSEIKWGTTPYWSQGAQKQYYVSKRCATKEVCAQTKRKYMPYCSHLWYQDWKCSDCCPGDRCNYYVIMGGSTAHSNAVMLASGVLLALTIARLLRA